MSVSLGSLGSTLHGMLTACVTEALGPSPPAKRKQPDGQKASVGQEQRCPNEEAATKARTTQQTAAPRSGAAPHTAKKPKLDLGSPAAVQPAAASSAAAFSPAATAGAAPTEPAAVRPAAASPAAPLELCPAAALPAQEAAPTGAARSPAAEPAVTAPASACASPAAVLLAAPAPTGAPPSPAAVLPAAGAPPAEPVLAVTAPTSVAAHNPAAAAPAAPLQLCCAPAVDLEAAVGELLGGAGKEALLPSTQLAPPAAAAAAAAAATAPGQPPAGEPSDGSTWDQAEVELEVDLQATQPACGGGDDDGMGAKAAASGAPAPTSAAELVCADHLSPPVPAAAPPTQPLPPLPAAAAPPPPTEAAALPTCVAAFLAIAAAHPPLPSGSPLVRRPAPSTHSTPASSQQPAQPSHVNMLKAGTDHDLYESGSASGDRPPSGSHGGWTTSGSCAAVPSPSSVPPTAAASSVTRELGPIAEYELQAQEVGSGGLGRVYAAVHRPSGRPVALKLGVAFDPRHGADDFTWATFKTEWNAYAHLASAGAASGATCGAGDALPWMAEPFECGLWEDGCGGVAPWMTLSLLGPSLHTLNQQRRAAVVQHLPEYARGMLAAVEGLHRHGLIHNDIKPANFVVPLGFDPSPATDAAPAAPGDLAPPLPRLPKGEAPPPALPPPQVLLIDFGFAFDADPAKAGQPWPFVGTPDFAASAALEGRRPGRADDLEALAYTLVELAAGQVPWDVTRHPGTEADISDWSAAALHGMLARRRAAWAAARADGRVPAWLGSWVDYCRGLPAGAIPSYDHLRSLIPGGAAEAGAEAAKAGVFARAAAWMAEE